MIEYCVVGCLLHPVAQLPKDIMAGMGGIFMLSTMNHEEIIEYLRSNPQEEEKCREYLIDSNFPFIVHTISKMTGRYVEVENSEELSIGLIAFNEAITRYEISRGAAFLSFAKLVITSRIKDYLSKENNKNNTISLEQLSEETGDQVEIADQSFESDVSIEIAEWESTIQKFGFDLEQLAEESPKHVDTRRNAVDLSEKISDDDEIVDQMYSKFKLPVTKVVLRFKTTSKVVKHSKKFIIATVVILTRKLNLLKDWIYQGEKRCSSC